MSWLSYLIELKFGGSPAQLAQHSKIFSKFATLEQGVFSQFSPEKLIGHLHWNPSSRIRQVPPFSQGFSIQGFSWASVVVEVLVVVEFCGREVDEDIIDDESSVDADVEDALEVTGIVVVDEQVVSESFVSNGIRTPRRIPTTTTLKCPHNVF